MAVILPNGRQSFITAAGLPLVGGRVYTYAAGTSTPLPTYADAAKMVPNTNPVILDARGDASIFWSGTYKVVLRDATDALIWTQDDVSTAGSEPNSFGSIADLREADTIVGSATVQTATGPVVYTFLAGDFSGKDDGQNIVASNSVPLSQGAWKRQADSALSSQLPQVTTAPAILSQSDINTLSVDVLQFIPRSRWDAVRAGSSTVPEDEAFEAALEWLYARAPFARLQSSARLLKLNAAHTINTKRIQCDFSGPLDFRDLPTSAAYALRYIGQQTGDLDGGLDRRAIMQGIQLFGNGAENDTVGHFYENCDHLLQINAGARGFAEAFSHGNNAYIIDHIGGYAYACARGFHGRAGTTNAGERFSFSQMTFAGCGVGLRQANGLGDCFLDKCSVDYSVAYDGGAIGPRFIENVAGRMHAISCHFEGNNGPSPMGALSAFYNGPDGAALTLSGEVIFANPFGNYLFENDNPTCPIDAEAWIFNAAGVGGRLSFGPGRVNLTMRTVQGGGATRNAGLLAEADNRAIDTNFDTTMRDVSVTVDQQGGGGTVPTSPYGGGAIALSITTEQNAGNGHSLKIVKTGAAGTVAQMVFQVPLSERGVLSGLSVRLLKPGTGTGTLFLTPYYAACHRNANDVLVIDRLWPFGAASVTFNYPNVAVPWNEYRFEGQSTRAPMGATHALIMLNGDSLTPIEIYAGTFIATEIG